MALVCNKQWGTWHADKFTSSRKMVNTSETVLFYKSTRVWVLNTPNAGQNILTNTPLMQLNKMQ